jgi:hypothetical protein
MRRCVALFLITTLFSAGALAAPKKNAKKTKEPSGPSMDTGGDPVAKETSDPGPYKPTGKTGALAEEEEEKAKPAEAAEIVKAKPRDRAVVFGDFVFGVGAAPWPGPASAGYEKTPDSVAFGLLIGGSYDLTKTFTLALRVPWSTATMDVPSSTSGAKESATAFGSPEILAEYRHSLGELTKLPIQFGVGIPLAQGNPDPSAGRVDQLPAHVNALADAASGWKDPELYWPKRVPLALSVGIRHETKRISLGAYTKLVAGINIGEELVNACTFAPCGAVDNGKLVLHPLALRSVTLAGIRYDVSQKFWVGADTWLVYNAIDPIRFESTAKPLTPLQWMLEPQVGLRFGKLRPSAGFLWPVVGRLTDTGIFGVRLHVDYAF